MRLQLPRCSVREDTARMAGAIFMSNSETREHCFGAGVFGLPPEYARFVAGVTRGMPLFLFDYTDRRLYGVFEASSGGGMEIHRGAFGCTGRTYPAQVCFNIVWKCRPLTEDEFFPAIEDNYYNSKKFYFDLSYQQVVNLYGLFDKKRVERPVSNYFTSASLEKEHSTSRRRPDNRSLSPNISLLSADQSHTLILSSSPKISTVETSCSSSISMHPLVPHHFETRPKVSIPFVTKPFGAQTAPIHSNQLQLPYHSHEHLRDVSTIDGTSTQVAAPCSQLPIYHQDRFVASQSYPLYHDYVQNRLSSGCSTQGPTDGVRLSVKQPYEGSSSLYSRYATQVPTADDRSYLTPYVPSYPHFSLSSPQCNVHLGDDYDNCEQCKAIYASEHQHLNRGKSLTPPELTEQAIPAYPEVPEVSAISQQKKNFTGYITIPDCTEGFDKEQPRRDFNRDVSVAQGSGNGTGTYISDRPYTSHDVEPESNTTAPCQSHQKTVFSRLSVKPQPTSQEMPGPSLNQLLYSLSKRSQQWSIKKTSPTEYVYNQFASDQEIDRPYAPAELNLPSGLEEEQESADPPFLDFKRRSKAQSLDTNARNKVCDNKAKRRKLVRPSFGQSSNTASSGKELKENVIMERNNSPVKTVGNMLQENVIKEGNNSPVETVGNMLQENVMMEMNQSTVETVGNKTQENFTMQRNQSPVETVGNKTQENVTIERNQSPVETVGNKTQENVTMERNQSPVETVGNKTQENVTMERNQSPVETGGNRFFIDLNEPASVDSDLMEDGNIAPAPALAVKTQSEKLSEVNINKPGCSVSKDVISKQDLPSEIATSAEKVTLDLNITDLNTMDEAKLQALLGSSLLQALDELRNGKSSNSEKAKPSLCSNSGVVKMEMKPDTGTNRAGTTDSGSRRLLPDARNFSKRRDG